MVGVWSAGDCVRHICNLLPRTNWSAVILHLELSDEGLDCSLEGQCAHHRIECLREVVVSQNGNISEKSMSISTFTWQWGALTSDIPLYPTFARNSFISNFRGYDMSSPSTQNIRRYVMTASVAAITATGAWYGAGLKFRREVKQVPGLNIAIIQVITDQILKGNEESSPGHTGGEDRTSRGQKGSSSTTEDGATNQD